jgi:formate hydrogenlyase subunit 4
MEPLLVVVQTMLLVALAPLWVGFVAWVRARLQMRRGAPPWQRYLDLARLLHKESVISANASWLARSAPYLSFACVLTAATWTPVLSADHPMGFAGDLVMTVALLAAVRVLGALAALDSGAAFGGFGASRHLMLSALAEPALLLAVFTLALGAGSTDLGRISRSVATAPLGWLSPSHLLALAATWLVVIAEAGRGPVDNPATHLELTMVHEGLTLDYSGRHLALVEWTSALRTLLLLTLVANLFLPWGIALENGAWSLAGALLAWLGKLLLFAFAVAITESVTARMRLFRAPEFLGMAFLLSLLALTSDSLMRG